MHINGAGLNIIKQCEGLRTKAYQDAKDIWTEGYGHTRGITQYSPNIDEEQAMEWLRKDVEEAEILVNKYIYTPLNENQFSALVSLVFNCGLAPLLGSLGKKLNAKLYNEAAEHFEEWDHENKVVSDGLLNRRLKEKSLFLTPVCEDT